MMIEILPGVFVTPTRAAEIHASLGRVIAQGREAALVRVGVPQIIHDVLDVWPSGEDKASSATLAVMLRSQLPGTYEGWTGAEVSRAMRMAGARKRQVWIGDRNVQGFWREDVERAS